MVGQVRPDEAFLAGQHEVAVLQLGNMSMSAPAAVDCIQRRFFAVGKVARFNVASATSASGQCAFASSALPQTTMSPSPLAV